MTAQPVCLSSLDVTAKGWSTSVATGEQLKALVKSYIDGDEERFFALALQVAAHEARRGHGKLASLAKADIVWQHVAEAATGRSYIDITRAYEDAAKERVLNDC